MVNVKIVSQNKCVCVCVCVCVSQNRHMKISLGTINFLKNNQLPDY